MESHKIAHPEMSSIRFLTYAPYQKQNLIGGNIDSVTIKVTKRRKKTLVNIVPRKTFTFLLLCPTQGLQARGCL